ncbi:hypothetical protein FAM09_29700 [Niastella caeni]|uniref:Uncharacterized protein n=1 Tax=Niastella caeni TaxID=2569763 RepID=A0A4S8H829_9BACT|nr:hypothetical protein [Niastella caeni]THU30777.1 hypothetical protein FAM09_29700 [Niastella caeni]
MSLHGKNNMPRHACRRVHIIIGCLLTAGAVQSQSVSLEVSIRNNQLKKNDTTHFPHSRNGDTILHLFKDVCKAFAFTRYITPPLESTTALKEEKAVVSNVVPSQKRKPFLSVHGNVQYSFLHQSYVDTPFSQRNFEQHTLQTSLQIVVKDRYPLRVNLSNRISNSPWFSNFFDVNMRFDQAAFSRNGKQRLLDKISAKQFQQPDLTLLTASLQQELDKYNRLKSWLASGDVLQHIVEERERQYYKNREADNQPGASFHLPEKRWPNKKGIALELPAEKSISVDSSYTKYISRKKTELDSLQQKIHSLQHKADSLNKQLNHKLVALKQKIYATTNPAKLRAIERENGLDSQRQKGFDNFLSHVKSIGIGRSVINYSELTASNVSLTGLNLEYNDGFYGALAIGKIDYGFRDFMGRNTRQKGQNFLMGRVGIGDIERKAIILSAFTGRKYNYGSVFADTVSDYIHVTGYALEAILKKDENTGISAEVAKTTIPVSGSYQNNQAMKSLFQFSDNANLGISIKGQTAIQRTGTRLSGLYRKTGEYFQSFSLFTYNTNQTAWSVKMEQPFWRNRINLIAMLRQNDFINPFSEKTFRTSTVFKSLQAQVRIPKWPVVSAGYYPGSQLYIINKERIRENVYYILNGSVVHNYTLGGVRMLSSLMYNRYSNKGTDSGFIAYNGISYMAAHTVLFPQFQVQGAWTYTSQEQMQFYTLDVNGEYSLLSWARIAAGVKYNKIAGGQTYRGGCAGVEVTLKKLGALQLQYEKSYLPTIWQTLYPVEVGRLSWFKNF